MPSDASALNGGVAVGTNPAEEIVATPTTPFGGDAPLSTYSSGENKDEDLMSTVSKDASTAAAMETTEEDNEVEYDELDGVESSKYDFNAGTTASCSVDVEWKIPGYRRALREYLKGETMDPSEDADVSESMQAFRVASLTWREKFFSPTYKAPNGDEWRIVCYPFGNRQKGTNSAEKLNMAVYLEIRGLNRDATPDVFFRITLVHQTDVKKSKNSEAKKAYSRIGEDWGFGNFVDLESLPGTDFFDADGSLTIRVTHSPAQSIFTSHLIAKKRQGWWD